MSLATIVWRNLVERKLTSALTSFSVALGVGVTIAILILQEQGRDNVRQNAFGYELIVGPRGSALQLVLNTVFHLDTSPGNVPYDLYKELRDPAKTRSVALALPVAVGDSYRGFRIVGTSDAFIRDFEFAPERRFALAAGRAFAHSTGDLDRIMDGAHLHPKFEAVLGSTVADRTGLTVGSTFVAEHGVAAAAEVDEHADSPWTVVGVLAPTGTPSDRAIYINLESFFAIQGHVRKAELSAIILTLKSAVQAPMLAGRINQRTDAQAVVPAQVMSGFFDQLERVDALLLAVSALVIVVAGVSILVSIYNSMAERRRAIAIMRALGARRMTILAIIELEAVSLCLGGGLAGLLLGHALAALAGRIIHSLSGVIVSPWAVHPGEAALLGGLVVLGGLVGIIPAVRAYRSDIADGLTYSA